MVVLRRLDLHMALMPTLTRPLKRSAGDDFRDLPAERLENLG